MKRVIWILAAVFSFVAASAQTTDEVINKYLSAAGGKEKLQAINTLQYTETLSLNTPMGAMEFSIQNIKERGKLLRRQTTNEITGESFMLITDTAGYLLMPSNPMFGLEGGLEKMKTDQLKAMSTEMDCSGYFIQLVDHATKGFTASLAGEEKIDGRVSYKLELKKDDNILTYMVDKETGLINALVAKGAAAAALSGLTAMGLGDSGGKASKAELTFKYADYKEVNGVKMPGTIKMDTPFGVLETKISDIKINEQVDAKWYKAQ